MDSKPPKTTTTQTTFIIFYWQLSLIHFKSLFYSDFPRLILSCKQSTGLKRIKSTGLAGLHNRQGIQVNMKRVITWKLNQVRYLKLAIRKQACPRAKVSIHSDP